MRVYRRTILFSNLVITNKCSIKNPSFPKTDTHALNEKKTVTMPYIVVLLKCLSRETFNELSGALDYALGKCTMVTNLLTTRVRASLEGSDVC